jgi:hypothetical protein
VVGRIFREVACCAAGGDAGRDSSAGADSRGRRIRRRAGCSGRAIGERAQGRAGEASGTLKQQQADYFALWSQHGVGGAGGRVVGDSADGGGGAASRQAIVWHAGASAGRARDSWRDAALLCCCSHEICEHAVCRGVEAGIFFGEGEAGEDVGFEIDVRRGAGDLGHGSAA